MMLTKRLLKDVVALLSTVAFTVLMVAGIANQGENLFVALVAFAFLAPMVASAAVGLKRDWTAQHHGLGHF